MASVHEYLRRANDVYKNARAEWCDLRDERTAIAAELETTEADKRLTPTARRERVIELKDSYKTKTREMLTVSESMNKELQSMRSEMAEAFYPHYHATAEALDLKAQAVIQSGILTIGELMEMGNKYSQNETMRRMIGRELEGRLSTDRTMNTDKAREVKNFAIWCAQPARQEHLAAFDNLADMYNRATGGRRKGSGDYSDTADKFAQIIADNFELSLENCENVTV